MKNKIFNIFLSACGSIFALMGLIIMIANFFAGLFMLLFGVTLIPAVYEKSKDLLKKYSGKIPKEYYDKMRVFWNKYGRYVKIAAPLVFFALFVVAMPKDSPAPAPAEVSAPVSSAAESTEEPSDAAEEKPEITSLHFEETELQLDINETKDLTLEIEPENADTQDLQYCTSNEEVAKLEKAEETSEGNKINLKLTPASEGECEVFAKTSKGVESNKIQVKIIDNERILAEEKAKQEEEEKARQEAEEKARKEEEEQARKAAEEEQARAKAEQEKKKAAEEAKKTTSSSSSGNNSSSSSKNNNNSHGKQVYRTPHGKRYHFDPDCGGKNSYQITMSAAVSAGLTPCKKCAH